MSSVVVIAIWPSVVCTALRLAPLEHQSGKSVAGIVHTDAWYANAIQQASKMRVKVLWTDRLAIRPAKDKPPIFIYLSYPLSNRSHACRAL
jgi:hypothetical protein